MGHWARKHHLPDREKDAPFIADITIAAIRLKQAFGGAADATENNFPFEAITRREAACRIADRTSVRWGAPGAHSTINPCA
jgi:hypothetical protein